MLPETAVLQGWFLADNKVKAVRLNGRAVSVSEHDEYPPFDRFHSFAAESGFVAGNNVLEVDVYNYASLQGAPTPMPGSGFGSAGLAITRFRRKRPRQLCPPRSNDLVRSPDSPKQFTL